MIQLGLLGLIVLLAAVIVEAILFVLFGRRQRREIEWRDRRIAALTAAIRNNEVYTLELQQRCERYRRALPPPCAGQFETAEGRRFWVWWN